MSSVRLGIEAKIDESSDAVVLVGAATAFAREADAADSDGLDAVAALYRAFAARLESMAEALEPTVL